MAEKEQKGNYRFQFKVFGIGLAIVVCVVMILGILGIIGWKVAIGIVVAVMFFEGMYFFVLRDTSPEPLTQYAMHKGFEFTDENGDKVRETRPGVYVLEKADKEGSVEEE